MNAFLALSIALGISIMQSQGCNHEREVRPGALARLAKMEAAGLMLCRDSPTSLNLAPHTLTTFTLPHI